MRPAQSGYTNLSDGLVHRARGWVYGVQAIPKSDPWVASVRMCALCLKVIGGPNLTEAFSKAKCDALSQRVDRWG